MHRPPLFAALLASLFASSLSSQAEAQTMYTIDMNSDVLYQIDVSTGVLSPVGPLGVNVAYGDLAFDSSTGILYMVDGWGHGISAPSELYTVNPSTGVATLVGSTGAQSLFALGYDPTTNKLYGAASTAGNGFYEINRTTGVATLIGIPGHDIDGLTYVGSTGALVGLNAGPGSVHQVTPSTGASALLSPGGGFVNNCGIAWLPSDNRVYCVDVSGNLYSFDVANGYQRTTVTGGLGGLIALAWTGAICPAPASYCTPSTTTNGCSPTISASGPLSVASTSGCLVDVASVEGQRAGMILYGLTGQVAFPWAAGSTSWFCVKAPVQRTPVTSSGGSTDQCNGALSIDLRAFLAANPGALGTPLTPGGTFHVQGWFRDPPAVRSTNLSDAVTIPSCP